MPTFLLDNPYDPNAPMETGFYAPRPDLVKIPVEVKPRKPTDLPLTSQPSQGASSAANSPVKGLSETVQNVGRGAGGDASAAMKENVAPRRNAPGNRDGGPFGGGGDEEILGYLPGFFGGPIFNHELRQWVKTLVTRATGEIIGYGGALQCAASSPDVQLCCRSTAIMQTKKRSQSGLWVTPRILLSTLHFQEWNDDEPTDAELAIWVNTERPIAVESEIHAQCIHETSPQVKLLHHRRDLDIGVFVLLDHFPDMPHSVGIDHLLEDHEAQAFRQKGLQVACVGYNGRIHKGHFAQIRDQVMHGLQGVLTAKELPKYIDLNQLIKAELRSFAAGTMDAYRLQTDHNLYGVSSSLWNGSSGGPCIITEGPHIGKIFGLVRGYDNWSEPFNLILGLPDGLRQAIHQIANPQAQIPASQTAVGLQPGPDGPVVDPSVATIAQVVSADDPGAKPAQDTTGAA